MRNKEDIYLFFRDHEKRSALIYEYYERIFYLHCEFEDADGTQQKIELELDLDELEQDNVDLTSPVVIEDIKEYIHVARITNGRHWEDKRYERS